jgi:hypothetical protein
LVLILGSFGNGVKYPVGSPAGYTGSPSDGKDCSEASCHGGNSAAVAGWITTNVPVQGYTAGASYSIMVTVTGNSSDAKGFEVSPQTLGGALLGTLTPGTGSKFAGSNPKYITHSTALTDASASWIFTWVAPPTGTGTVTFYGAFVSGFPNIFHSTRVIFENITGISEPQDPLHFTIYPNPVNNLMNLHYTLSQPGHTVVSLYDLTGNRIRTLLDEEQSSGDKTHSIDLSHDIAAGVYIVKIVNGNSAPMLRKVIFN